jgi:hypothetical protein
VSRICMNIKIGAKRGRVICIAARKLKDKISKKVYSR